MDPSFPPDLGDHEHDLAAVTAARDRPRRLCIHAELGDYCLGAAVGARPAGRSHVAVKQLKQLPGI
jgi:hypothetical protein